MNNILFLSFWNPTPATPGRGVFIHEQAFHLATAKANFVFVEINIVNGSSCIPKISSDLSEFERGKKLRITISSVFWKVIYQLPTISTFIVWREIKRNGLHQNIDIVHSNVVFPCGMVGVAISKKAKARFFISEHWSKVKTIASNPFWKKKIVDTYHSAESVICVSEWLKQLVLSVAPSSKVVIIPNIVSPKSFYPNYNQEQKTAKSITFSCVASWQLPKRLDIIAMSLCEFAKTREKQEHVVLNIIGGGDQTSTLNCIDWPSNITIIKHGYLEKSMIGDILRTSDYFMHASETETCSIVVAEALTCGLPVIASNVGALPSLINENNGVLCENSVKAWVDGLNIITSKNYSKELISNDSQKFSPEHFTYKISQLYSK